MEYRSSVGVTRGPDFEKMALEAHEEFASSLRGRLVELQRQTPDLAKWQWLDIVAKESVDNLYREKVGINISREQPDAYFLTRENMDRIGLDPDSAATLPSLNLVIYSVFRRDNSLSSARLLGPFHERFHHSGRTVLTIRRGRAKSSLFRPQRMKGEVGLAQLGLMTEGNEVRGEGFEEAAAVYYSLQLFRQARDGGVIDFRKRLGFDRQVTFDDRSSAGCRLYAALLTRAGNLGLRDNIEDLILRTRVLPYNKFALFNLLAVVIGSRDLARKLISLNSRAAKEVEEFISLLE